MPTKKLSPLDALTKRLPPPPSPLSQASPSFDAVEHALGFALPDDVKAFLSRYGTGKIDDFVRVHDVRDPAWLTWVNQVVDAMRTAGDVPGPFFPAPGGLLPLASTDNGDTICLRMHGAPAAWTVVVCEGRGPDAFVFDGGFVAFIDAVLARRVECTVFPDSFPAKKSRFEKPKAPPAVVAVLLGASTIEFGERKQSLRAIATRLLPRSKVVRDAPLALRIVVGTAFQVDYIEHVPEEGVEPGSALSAVMWSGDATRARKVFAAFVKETGLAVRAITDRSGSPIWPEGL